MGDVFEVVFNTTSDKLSSVPISEIASLNKAIYYPEISYVSYDGENWQDLFYLTKTYALHTYKSQVACIKAFTVLTDYNTSIDLKINGSKLEIGVSDQFNQSVRNGKVNVRFNNSTKEFVLTGGKISVPFSLHDGVYNVNVKYSGDGYNNSDYSGSFEVLLKIDLPANEVYTLNSEYKLVVHDQFDKRMLNKTVIIKIDNRQFEKTSDENGEISLNIDLNVGEYNLEIINPQNNESISGNIKVVSRLTDNANVIMYYGANGYYKVRVHGDFGEILSNEMIKININGKIYSVKSDKNGFASVKLDKFQAKSYTVTAEYRGFKVSNKIVIKPTLTAKNKSVRKGKTLKFQAKLVNAKGKALKGKKITFKIKGKKYTAKTNKKGIATIKVKKLKVGKYIIKTSYGKLSISNKITVKK